MSEEVAEQTTMEQTTAEQATEQGTQQATVQAVSWLDRLPEELRNDPSVVKHKSETDLARGYVNLSKLLGHEKVPVPKEGDDASVFENYYRAGGRPDKAQDYNFTVPEGVEIDDTILNEYKEAFHKAGASQKVIDAALSVRAKEIETHRVRAEQQAKDEYNATHTALKLELGEKYSDSLAKAQQIMSATMSEELQKKLIERGLANDVDMIKMALGISKLVSNDDFSNFSGVGMNQPRATEEITKLKSGDAYWNAGHPEHKAVKQRVRDLLGYLGETE